MHKNVFRNARFVSSWVVVGSRREEGEPLAETEADGEPIGLIIDAEVSTPSGRTLFMALAEKSAEFSAPRLRPLEEEASADG